MAKGIVNVFVDKNSSNAPTTPLPAVLRHAGVGQHHDLRPLIDRLRLVKSQWEVEAMQQAADVSCSAFRAAMHATVNDPAVTNEGHIDAMLEYKVRMYGAPYLAYPPVVASGKHACTLHYIANNKVSRVFSTQGKKPKNLYFSVATGQGRPGVGGRRRRAC
jgi:Xaa-Pro aminopeptidase